MKEHQYINGCKNKCGSCNLCCLAVCSICGLYEGALTTHCPNRPVSFEESEVIYQGFKNFRSGLWLDECTEHSPAFRHRHEQQYINQCKLGFNRIA